MLEKTFRLKAKSVDIYGVGQHKKKFRLYDHEGIDMRTHRRPRQSLPTTIVHPQVPSEKVPPNNNNDQPMNYDRDPYRVINRPRRGISQSLTKSIYGLGDYIHSLDRIPENNKYNQIKPKNHQHQ
eukprot:UN26125